MNENFNLESFVIDDTIYETRLSTKFKRQKPYKMNNPKIINAFIPGGIREIFVKNEQIVKKGDKLLVLEAMKMLNLMKSPVDGKVKRIHVNVGNQVMKNQTLIELE